jgi:subtilisin family serine protease
MRTLRKYTSFLTRIHGFAFFFLFLFSYATPQLSEVLAEDSGNDYQVLHTPLDPIAIEGEYLIQFKTDKPLNNIKKGNNPAWVSKLGKDVQINTSLSDFKIAHFKVSNPTSTGQWENLANILSSEPSIESVEPNYLVYPSAVPNDPKVSDMWFLKNISAFKAWDLPSDGPDTIVAIVDTGIQFDHEDLKGHIWINNAEIRDNGIDDDHNGYIDDIVGWNFHNYNNFPYAQYRGVPINADCQPHPTQKEFEFHGTHVAGTMAAIGNNATGVVGIANHIKIMPIKALGGPCGRGSNLSVLLGVLYAYENGARIINLSLSSSAPSKLAAAIYQKLSEKGVLIVAAAGNESRDNDAAVRAYPASYPFDGILSVAATEPNDELADFSNYGRTNVDIAAPGSAILSTIPKGTDASPISSYTAISGTSMATPIVSGAAAVLLTQDPKLTNIQIKHKLMASVDKIPALEGKIVSGGRLNLYNALTYTGTMAQAPKQGIEPTNSSQQIQSVGGIRIFDQRSEKNKW